MEVSSDVIGSIVERFVKVTLISLKFMSIHKVIKEFEHTILERDYGLTLWVEIEWHMVVSLNSHESSIDPEEWERQWSFLDIS
jgi:hypothetical protein